MVCFHAEGLLCPPALALLGGGQRCVHAPRRALRGVFFPLPAQAPWEPVRGRTLGPSPAPSIACPKMLCLGRDPRHRSRAEGRCAWGKVSSPVPLGSVRCCQEFVPSLPAEPWDQD